MAIRLGCKCGQQVITEESYMGQTIRCPHCNILLKVPQLQQHVQQTAPQPPPSSPPAYQSPPPPSGGYPQAPQQPSGFQATPPNQAPQQPDGIQATPPQPDGRQYVQTQAPPPNAPAGPAEDMPVLEQEYDDYDYEDEDKRSKSKKKKERRLIKHRQLKLVGTGLMLIQWSIMCMLAALGCAALNIILFIVTLFSAVSTGSAGAAGRAAGSGFAAMGIIALIGLLLVLAFAILYLTGCVFCCFVPPKSKARPLIITSISLVGGAFLLYIAIMFMFFAAMATGSRAAAGVASGLGIMFMILSVLMLIASLVLFMLYLRALAFYLKEIATGNEVIVLLLTWLVLSVLYVPMAWFVGYLTILIPIIGGILALVILVCYSGYWVLQWIKVLNLIAALRQVLGYQYNV